MSEQKSKQYRILVKPGDKATVVVYPGAGFSDKADENYKADCASAEGASTYLAESANSFAATVRMAESSVAGKEIERLVWTGDKRYARLTCTFEEATVGQIDDIFEKPNAGAVEKWGVARDRVRDRLRRKPRQVRGRQRLHVRGRADAVQDSVRARRHFASCGCGDFLR